MDENPRINGLKVYAIIATVGLVSMGSIIAYSMFFMPVGANQDCTNISAGNYSMGYIQGLVDVIREAYTNGIVKIPINSTNYVALIPYGGNNG